MEWEDPEGPRHRLVSRSSQKLYTTQTGETCFFLPFFWSNPQNAYSPGENPGFTTFEGLVVPEGRDREPRLASPSGLHRSRHQIRQIQTPVSWVDAASPWRTPGTRARNPRRFTRRCQRPGLRPGAARAEARSAAAAAGS